MTKMQNCLGIYRLALHDAVDAAGYSEFKLGLGLHSHRFQKPNYALNSLSNVEPISNAFELGLFSA